MKKVYELAKGEVGTYEWADGSNPKINEYFADVGFKSMTDETAWCAAFAGSMLKRAKLPHTGKLTARSYLDWGKPVELDKAEPGDVVVLWRGSPDGWQGHVGFYVRKDGKTIYLLGGNQSNQVNVSGYKEDRVLGVRRMSGRDSPAKSKTLQGAAAGSASALTMIGTAVAALDSYAQYLVIVLSFFVVCAFLWIGRERLRKWAEGER